MTKRYCPNCPKYVKRPNRKPKIYFDRTGKIIRRKEEDEDTLYSRPKSKDKPRTKVRPKTRSKQVKAKKSSVQARIDHLNKIKTRAQERINNRNEQLKQRNRAIKNVKKDKKDKPDKKGKEKKHISRHTYYGIDRDTEAGSPDEGDIFVHLLTGEWSIYRHGLWTKIPSPSPRSYLGPSTAPGSAVPAAKEGSLYFDAEGRIYVYQSNEWQLVPMTMVPILPSMNLLNQEQSSALTLTISPDLSSETLQTETGNFNLKPSHVIVKIDTTTNSYYHSQFSPEYGVHDTLEFQIVPKGTQQVTLSKMNGHQFQLSFGMWIQYVDNNGQTWQTVIGLSNLTLYDDNNGEITDYQFEPTSDPRELVSLMDGTYITTMTRSHEILISSQDVCQAEWSYVLLAYRVTNEDESEKDHPKQFYVVKDFHDLEKQIDHTLPHVTIKILSDTD